MGNAVESVEKLETPVRNRNQVEDHDVIDLDRDNWQEKVQEHKRIWYAHHSTNSKNITRGKEKLCLQQASSRKKLHTTLKTIEDTNERVRQSEIRKPSTNQENDIEFQQKEQGFLRIQEEEILKKRQELTESSLRSRQRIEYFQKKYKLYERNCSSRDNNVDLTDRIKEKEEREKAKKLRHQIRAKYQLPVELGSQRLILS